MNVKILRLAGFFGVATPALGFAMILLAISFSPWFSWTDNALSDLGVSGFGSVIFNSGLAMTGALAMIFFLGLRELSRGSRVGQVGAFLFSAAAAFLVGVGVFNETFGRIHLYVSVGFFVSLGFSLLIMVAFFAMKRKWAFAILTLAAGVVDPLVWSLPHRGAALPEAVSALAAGVWSVTLGVWMMKAEESRPV